MFKSTSINLGTVSVGSKNVMEFPYEDILTIDKVTKSCECSSAINDVGAKKIIIEFKAQPIPMHLKLGGQTTQSKTITIEVEYTDVNNEPRIEKLNFNAIISE